MANLWWNDEQQCRHHKMRCCGAESREEVSAYSAYVVPTEKDMN